MPNTFLVAILFLFDPFLFQCTTVRLVLVVKVSLGCLWATPVIHKKRGRAGRSTYRIGTLCNCDVCFERRIDIYDKVKVVYIFLFES